LIFRGEKVDVTGIVAIISTLVIAPAILFSFVYKVTKDKIDESEKPWLTDYQAHLHINLLPSLQGKGAGRALMDALFTELERQKVPGLSLGVDASNTGAVTFYRKMGFSVLKEQEWGFIMGKLS
jgi:ribosomal protein S18 acetylase RimI-like enzyme